MVDVHTLEVVTEPRQLAQSAVADGPVRQQSAQSREERERLATHARIGIEEGWHHHIGTVWVDRCALGIKLASCQGGTSWIGHTLVLLFHTAAEAIERGDKLLECLAAITTVGAAHSLEGGAQRDSGHLEGSALRGRRALIHILYALLRGHRARGNEVYLQVLHWLQCHANLQVLGLARDGRGGDGVV